MADRYHSFAELAAHEKEGHDYRIRITPRESPVAIFAPHGGRIEPGTSEITAAIAADMFSFYCFEGLVPERPHTDLHITSDYFDEPQARALAAACNVVITIHGRWSTHGDVVTWIGGLDKTLGKAIATALEGSGFATQTENLRLSGEGPSNICNSGRTGKGVQLELPRDLRDELTTDDAKRADFVNAVRRAITSLPS